MPETACAVNEKPTLTPSAPGSAVRQRLLGTSLLLALLAMAWRTQAAPPEPIKIALLPMVVHSAESPEYVRAGLADMLTARLERVPDFDVIRIDEESAATTNLEKALRVARKAGARYVVFGSFTRFGMGASLDIQCAATDEYQTDDPSRDIFIHSGTLADVIPDLDDLVGKVARFVVAGYVETKGEKAANAPVLPSTRAITELRARVTSLEQALRDLTAKLESAKLLPRDSAGSAASLKSADEKRIAAE